MAEKSQTVITPPGIACYAFVHEPAETLKGGKDYRLTLLIDKHEDISELRTAVRLAAERKFGDKARKIPLKLPLRDGDKARPDDKLFKGKYFFTARSTSKPGLVDKRAKPILDAEEFYSGCICRVSVYAFGFDKNGSKGVSFLLNNIQKLKEGERLSGRKPAEEEFDAVDGDDSTDILD